MIRSIFIKKGEDAENRLFSAKALLITAEPVGSTVIL